MRTRTRADGDVELVAQEEVLDDEVVAIPEEGAQGEEEDSEQFEHFVRVAGRAGPSFALLQPLPPSLPDEVTSLLRRMRLPYMRGLARCEPRTSDGLFAPHRSGLRCAASLHCRLLRQYPDGGR